MTVQDWMASRTPAPPGALRDAVRAALGPDAAAPVSRTTDICLRAAARELRSIVESRRFDRSGALDLLVVDALTTYAYEYASTAASSDLDRAATDGLRWFGELADSHG